MANQTIPCTACGKSFSAAFQKCPFCNAPASRPGGQPSSSEEFARIAESVIARNRAFVHLAYTSASIKALDFFINQTWGEEGESPGGEAWKPPQNKKTVILSLGIYLGEVLRRLFAGRWEEDKGEPPNALKHGVAFEGDLTVFPIHRVYERFKNGSGAPLYPLVQQIEERIPQGAGAELWRGWLDQAGRFESMSRPDLAVPFYEKALTLSLPADERPAIQERLDAAVAAARQSAEAESSSDAAPGASSAEIIAGWHESSLATLDRAGAAVRYSPSSLAALDLYLNAIWGVEPLGDETNTIRNQQLERVLGSYLGELLCRRLKGSWKHDKDPGLSRVAWPGGSAVSPFGFLRKRMENGAAHSLYRQFLACRAQLAERGEIPAPPAEAEEWFAQAERLASIPGRKEAAVAFGEQALKEDPSNARLWCAVADWLAEMEGRAPDAIEHFDSALSLDPELVPAIIGKARLTLQRGEPDAAFELLETALGLDPENVEALTRRGDIYMKRGNFGQALLSYEGALRSAPGNDEALLGKGACLLAHGKTSEAAEVLTRLVNSPACPPIAWYLRGEALEHSGRKIDAYESYNKYARFTGEPAQVLETSRRKMAVLEMDRGYLTEHFDRLADEGNTEGAVELLDRMLQLFPDDAELWREKGVGFATLNRTEEALACLDKAILLAPENPSGWDHKAVVFARMERYDDGLKVIDQGLKYSPESETLWMRRGFLLGRMDDLPGALRNFERALAINPGYQSAWLLKSEIDRQAGAPREAIRSLESYLSCPGPKASQTVTEVLRTIQTLERPETPIQPQEAMEMEERAIGFVNQEAYAQAMECFDAAVRLDAGVMEIWFNRGLCALKLNNAAKALESFDRALAFLRMTQFLKGRAQALAALDRYEEALETHDEILKANPRDTQSLQSKAFILRLLQRPLAALACLEELVALAPDDARALSDLGDMYREAKEYDKALAAHDAAIALAPEDPALLLAKSVCLSEVSRAEEAFELQKKALTDPELAEALDREDKLLAELVKRMSENPE